MRETPAQRYETGQDEAMGDVENRSHNPKVAGLNPASATTRMQVRAPRGGVVCSAMASADHRWAFPFKGAAAAVGTLVGNSPEYES